MARRVYTPDEKAQAVAHYLEHGLAEAHNRTQIPRATLQDWARKAGHNLADISGHTAEKTRAAVAAHQANAAEIRALLQAELLAAARIHVAKSLTADGKNAQHYMTAGAIGLDKYRLELGEATDRTEVVSPERRPEHDEEIAILYDLTERLTG
jgi:transposase-like protein